MRNNRSRPTSQHANPPAALARLDPLVGRKIFNCIVDDTALVAGVKKVVVLMEHTAGGKPKLLHECALPLTGKAVVDMVITELAVFTIDRHQGGMTLVELAPGVDAEEVRAKTGPALVDG